MFTLQIADYTNSVDKFYIIELELSPSSEQISVAILSDKHFRLVPMTDHANLKIDEV